jgi:uncharacterized NAD-dependent epimerase/dehydratase family protein
VPKRIPIFASLHQAVEGLERRPDYLVVGLSPEDGRFPPYHRKVIRDALRMGVSVDSALRPYLHEDAEFPGLAQQSSARIRSVGYPRTMSKLRAYTGAIEAIPAAKVTVVGTNSVVGKRTTTVRLAEALAARGLKTEMIGTGETSWLQGVRSTAILDSIVSRYVAGELEGVIVDAYDAYRPDVFVLEGQGSVLKRSKPSGVELLTTARPDAIVMQHAPTHPSLPASDRFGIETLERNIRVAELLSCREVVAIALNPEGCTLAEFGAACEAIRGRFGLLVTDVMADGPEALAETVVGSLRISAAAS